MYEPDNGAFIGRAKALARQEGVYLLMVIFRAIENGVSLVRQTDTGLSIAVDPYGRVLAQTDYFGATDRTLVAQVPVKHVPTIYTLFGRYFE